VSAKKPRRRVLIACRDCGNEVTASPGMAAYALSGKAECVRCSGAFRWVPRPQEAPR